MSSCESSLESSEKNTEPVDKKGVSIHKAYIVRHSERIDEVDYKLWERIVKATDTARNKGDMIDDPKLTENGKQIAEVASNTLTSLLNETLVSHIYSSKLRRCVETAYCIALRLGTPILISKGLSLTAAAVEYRREKFEFLSLDELKEFCPGVELVDCDDPSSEFFIPSLQWLDTLNAIIRKEEVSIIVAHRETIRNIAGPDPSGRRMATPYCCIAEFDCPNTDAAGALQLVQLVGSEGDVIYNNIGRNRSVNAYLTPPPTPVLSNKGDEK